MIGSYYFWRWADNDLPGRPPEVHASLLGGELHPALQIFDARPLLRRLEAAAAKGRDRREEWDWQVTPEHAPQKARFVFVTCPKIDASKASEKRFARQFEMLRLSGVDETTGRIIPGLLPKLNYFETGQSSERWYDVTVNDLPALIKGIRAGEPHPFGILQDRLGSFTQCFAERRRYCVEWHESHDPTDQTKFDHWRAEDRARLAAIGGHNSEKALPYNKEPDLLRYSDTLRIFTAFLRGEPRPTRNSWRNINHII